MDAIGIGYVAGNLEPHLHADPDAIVDGAPAGNAPDGVEFEPDELIVRVPQTTHDHVAASGGRAAGSQWDPIGVAAGQSYWFLPQSSVLADTLAAPFAGSASEELLPGDWAGQLRVTLTAANMPAGAHFSLATVTLGVPTFFISTLGGVDARDTSGIDAGAHRHFNWYFSQPGSYELSFGFTGTHLVDGAKAAAASRLLRALPGRTTAEQGERGKHRQDRHRHQQFDHRETRTAGHLSPSQGRVWFAVHW